MSNIGPLDSLDLLRLTLVSRVIAKGPNEPKDPMSQEGQRVK